MENEIWITRIFNDYLSGLGNSLLGLVGMHGQARPWANYITMEILVVAIIMVLFAVLRTQLSVEKPGKLQHTFELIYGFVRSTAVDQIGHDGPRHVAFCGTLFVFILFMNLIGIIPGFESPTQTPSVTAGCAIAAFFYYNIMGVMALGPLKYAAHFAGPVWWLSPLMIPIEIVSHLARPLSLTIRLFANMFAGEKVTMVFMGLVSLGVPVVFMGLHVFVSLLQAYIFMILTMVYVGTSVAHEH
jgi:F-type H+-transporting ATPase subunit a